MKKTEKYEIQVRVNVLRNDHTGLEFDLIDSDNCIKEFRLDDYELRNQMQLNRRDTPRRLIYALVREYVEQSMPTGTVWDLEIIFPYGFK